MNTQTQIDALLEEAAEHYSQKTIDKLRDIMIPLYLGIEQDKISKSVKTDTDKVIVFNHRTKEYRGWKRFIKIIQELKKPKTRLQSVLFHDRPNRYSDVKEII